MPKNIKIYVSKVYEASFNLAFEQFIFEECSEDEVLLYLWQNEKTIVVGRHQNPYKECNLELLQSDGFLKLIADETTKVILGGSVVGPHATDLMAIIGNLISTKTTIEMAKNVIYAHPTTAESIHEAILMLEGKGIHFA